jgi:Flp pilus assembly protein TadG
MRPARLVSTTVVSPGLLLAHLRHRSTTAADRERGSAIAEFVMVAALLLFVAMGVFQLGLALYVRNTLISAASEGARYGARADAQPGDGVSRTKALITTSLSASFAQDVSAARALTLSGVRVVEVRVTAPLPVIGPIGPAGGLTVSGRAFSEEQVVAGADP